MRNLSFLVCGFVFLFGIAAVFNEGEVPEISSSTDEPEQEETTMPIDQITGTLIVGGCEVDGYASLANPDGIFNAVSLRNRIKDTSLGYEFTAGTTDVLDFGVGTVWTLGGSETCQTIAFDEDLTTEGIQPAFGRVEAGNAYKFVQQAETGAVQLIHLGLY